MYKFTASAENVESCKHQSYPYKMAKKLSYKLQIYIFSWTVQRAEVSGKITTLKSKKRHPVPRLLGKYIARPRETYSAKTDNMNLLKGWVWASKGI